MKGAELDLFDKRERTYSARSARRRWRDATKGLGAEEKGSPGAAERIVRAPAERA